MFYLVVFFFLVHILSITYSKYDYTSSQKVDRFYRGTEFNNICLHLLSILDYANICRNEHYNFLSQCVRFLRDSSNIFLNWCDWFIILLGTEY